MRPVFAFILLAGCGESSAPATDMGDSCTSGETLTFTLEVVERHLHDPEGGVSGIDLDGRVSDWTDEASCHQEDWVDSVDGETGVDNQGALLVNNTGEVQPDLIVTPGQRFSLELRHVDDLANDSCVELSVGGSEPTRAALEGGRFRVLRTGAALEVMEEADDGSSVGFAWRLTDVAIKGAVDADGAIEHVTLASRLSVDDTVDHFVEVEPMLDPDLVRTTLDGIADLDPDEDGRCQSFSVAFGAQQVH